MFVAGPAYAQPSNDNFAAAETITEWDGQPYTWEQGNVQDATLEPGEPQACGPIVASVWYRYQVTGASPVALDFSVFDDGPSFAPVTSVYTGSSLDTLVLAACRTGDGQIKVRGEPGTTYYVQVGAAGSATGRFGLTVTQEDLPSNDALADATVIESIGRHGTAEGSAYLGLATMEPGEPQPSCGPVNATIWYRMDPRIRTEIALTESTGTGTATLAIYRQTSTGLVELGCRNTGVDYLERWVMPRAPHDYYFQLGTNSTQASGGLSVASAEPCTWEDCLPPCETREFDVRPERFPAKQVWYLNAGNKPAYLTRREIVRAVKGAIATVSRAGNDCGMGNKDRAVARYGGLTKKHATSCRGMPFDRMFVIEFGPRIGSGIQCGQATQSFDFRTGRLGPKRWDLDIGLDKDYDPCCLRFDDPDKWGWTTKPESVDCFEELDLQGLLTHELTHAFRLDHVGGSHANLTMSELDWRDQPHCNSGARTLGRGDVLGLRKAFPPA